MGILWTVTTYDVDRILESAHEVLGFSVERASVDPIGPDQTV